MPGPREKGRVYRKITRKHVRKVRAVDAWGLMVCVAAEDAAKIEWMAKQIAAQLRVLIAREPY